ncbi:hypothetical protein [Haloplasma contractile]|uniref:Uncharacterized protein n=1 Tax=Haloplasma contractile SSD-17B TaxID=1033810 RepID=U2EAJ3_9MOLU|nr:hypothetical protein [Haloplasma contractile]ERJ12118.1 hypothetical protein HLPCO_001645 [Haloplasma contractile SSD-17B]
MKENGNFFDSLCSPLLSQTYDEIIVSPSTIDHEIWIKVKLDDKWGLYDQKGILELNISYEEIILE